MTRLVIDASAAIDTLGRPDVAQHLVHRYRLTAPALISWEIGQVVHSKHPKLFGDAKTRRAVVRALLAPVELIVQADRLDALADLVESSGLSFYDASYLQLALDEGCALLTQDKKLLAAATRTLGASKARSLASEPEP